ncbi:MAG TPA: L-aspartate oxidase [Pantanalinema sp.]
MNHPIPYAHSLPVLVIGSGISGLWTSLELVEQGQRVVLVTKQNLMDSNTRYAQGGIAAAIAGDDAPTLHFNDTLEAGAGLCDEEPVRVLTNEGPAQLSALIEAGVRFDREPDGTLATTLEAAHSRRRVVHALGDATGYEIERALVERVRRTPSIDILEHAFALELVVQDGRCRGAVVLDADKQVRYLAARAVVLAAGGVGRAWSHTTNPATATGDGIALAYRAGAEISDMEFMQFHPTALVVPGGDSFLVSEAVRGEGAILRNASNEAFMVRYHPKKELAPRDVVARAIAAEMEKDASDHVWLDLRHMSPELIESRFPTIMAYCRQHGINPPADMLPVAPAAHYFIGGARTDLSGRTSVSGLYAVGEAASTGVHGANRLASNSLLEAVVFGRRAAEAIAKEGPSDVRPIGETVAHYPAPEAPAIDVEGLRAAFQAEMWQDAGLLRTGSGLERALARIRAWRVEVEEAALTSTDRSLHELRNLLQVGELVAAAALWREESRGTHFRTDFAAKDDSRWLKHFTQSLQVLEAPSTR